MGLPSRGSKLDYEVCCVQWAAVARGVKREDCFSITLRIPKRTASTVKAHPATV
jgi:hypothetical protein